MPTGTSGATGWPNRSCCGCTCLPQVSRCSPEHSVPEPESTKATNKIKIEGIKQHHMYKNIVFSSDLVVISSSFGSCHQQNMLFSY